MTFLNWTLLLGLGAVAIPILVHLLNRRQARTVPWGAMRFLKASLARRNRSILLEDILLMTLRCLTVALLVMALARPYLPSRSSLGFLAVLAPVLMGAVLAGLGAIVSARRLRYVLWGLGLFMVIAATGASLYEEAFQKRFWSLGEGERDIALVIDASSSMTLEQSGRSNFQQAVDEARSVIPLCRPDDAVSLILAGPVPRRLIAAPSYDRRELQSALDQASPIGGPQDVAAAFQAAADSLSQGHNPLKRIVFITDGQNVGYDLASPSRWDALAGSLKYLGEKPQVIVRTLGLPSSLRNLCVADVRLLRGVVGTDRAVGVEVKVTNTGTMTMGPASVELTVDALVAGRRDLGPVPANSSQTTRFDWRFQQPGPHVVQARLASKSVSASAPSSAENYTDDMPADDVAVRVVSVMQDLPVLIVEGLPSPRPLEGAGSLVNLAMAPGPGPQPPSSPAASGPSQASNFLLAPKVVAATDLAGMTDFGSYRLVVLADVPRLNSAAADVLARFVQGGGGLLICLGDQAQSDFYNHWTTPAGQRLCGADLGEARVVPGQPARLAVKTFAHPVLYLLADERNSDAQAAMVHGYWPLTVDERDQTARVAGLLDNGLPFLVERKVGHGCVLIVAMSLDRRDSNLPTLQCFVPLVHEMAYFLAAPSAPQLNFSPSAELALSVPLPQASAGVASFAPGGILPVLTPWGQRIPAAIVGVGQALDVRLRGADQPGLYRLELTDARTASGPASTSIPLAVLNDASESRLGPLSADDLVSLGTRLPMLHARSNAELTSAIGGDVPGQELWRAMALAALGCLVSEVALARWIARQRGNQGLRPLRFGSQAADARDFRARARKMVSIPAEAAGQEEP